MKNLQRFDEFLNEKTPAKAKSSRRAKSSLDSPLNSPLNSPQDTPLARNKTFMNSLIYDALDLVDRGHYKSLTVVLLHIAKEIQEEILKKNVPLTLFEKRLLLAGYMFGIQQPTSPSQENIRKDLDGLIQNLHSPETLRIEQGDRSGRQFSASAQDWDSL